MCPLTNEVKKQENGKIEVEWKKKNDTSFASIRWACVGVE